MKKISFIFSIVAIALFVGVGVVSAQPTATATPPQDDQQQPTVAPTVGQQPDGTTPTPTGVLQVPGRTTPTPSSNTSKNPNKPDHESVAHADACGYFRGMTVDQVPDRWQNCRKCIYPGFGEADINPLNNQTLEGVPTPDLYHIYTDFGCLSTDPGEFAGQISSFFFSIVGSIAFLFFIYGAGVIATSRSDPGKLNQGKRIVYGAIIGLLFALFAVFIIRFISTGIGIPLG